jgi:Reverse transcriptase (RNA-dependent DNA polymerase)
LKTKRNSDGSIEQYKTRLVAKGYTQEKDIYYTNTYSQVIKFTTIYSVLTLVVTRSWKIRQLDINNVFLHGTLNEENYMAEPPEFIDSHHPTHVCRLHKIIYA